MEGMYCSISGYWKDDETEFEGYIVRAYDDVPSEDDEYTDEDIFYYGLSESEIIKAIEDNKNGIEDALEFVITSYEKL